MIWSRNVLQVFSDISTPLIFQTVKVRWMWRRAFVLFPLKKGFWEEISKKILLGLFWNSIAFIYIGPVFYLLNYKICWVSKMNFEGKRKNSLFERINNLKRSSCIFLTIRNFRRVLNHNTKKMTFRTRVLIF